jgi:hypothetical protein
MLKSLNPRKGYIPTRRNVKFNKGEWEQLKKNYNYSCATCNNTENEPDRYDENKITKLEKGHMNPKLPLTLGNTIPHCSECNSQYKDKFIFNKLGRIIGTT